MSSNYAALREGKLAVTNDVIKKIATETKIPSFRVRAYLKATTDIIGEALSGKEDVDLPKLGIFRLMNLPSRKVTTNFGGKKQVLKLQATTTADFTISQTIKENLKETPESQKPKEDVEDAFRTIPIQRRGSDVQFIELGGKSIPKDILALVPEHIAKKYSSVPFALEGKTLSIAMTDPENEEAFNAIRKLSGKLVKPFLATQEDINHIRDQYSGLQDQVKGFVDDQDEENVKAIKEKEDKVKEEDITETSPAAKIVSSLLKRAVRERASDIHIEPSEEDVRVRFRVDGVLRKVLNLPKEIQPAIISRVKILATLKIDETRLPQDGRIQILLDGNKVDFRISILPTVNGEKVVARVLDHSKGVLDFKEIGIWGRSLTVLEDNIKKSHGMSLVTGPTGSGKSTTLYSIITKIQDDSINIITMEDPVEYRMPGISQSQVNSKIDFTFANGLRSILRQDPDVVMVGEIRDRETADIAVNAALTGHIVLSTLHTNDAVGAIPRLLDMKVEPFLITSSLNSVIAQRLCRRICEKCKTTKEISSEELKVIQAEIETLPEPEKSEAKKENTYYYGKGCDACGDSGYKGRIGIYEILIMSDPMKTITVKGGTSIELLAQAKKEGLITLKQDGILKAQHGDTTIEEVWRVTKD